MEINIEALVGIIGLLSIIASSCAFMRCMQTQMTCNLTYQQKSVTHQSPIVFCIDIQPQIALVFD